MWKKLWKYRGVDHLGTLFLIVGTYLLGNGMSLGFVMMGLANICYTYVGVKSDSWGIVIASAILFVLNVRGLIISWT